MIAAALVGCASAGAGRDLAAGDWIGQIDRGSSLQPFKLHIEDGGTYRGEWRSQLGLRSEPLQNVDVKGDTVRFETDRLLFVGSLQGKKLSGTVSHKGTDVPDAEFSVIYDGLDDLR